MGAKKLNSSDILASLGEPVGLKHQQWMSHTICNLHWWSINKDSRLWSQVATVCASWRETEQLLSYLNFQVSGGHWECVDLGKRRPAAGHLRLTSARISGMHDINDQTPLSAEEWQRIPLGWEYLLLLSMRYPSYCWCLRYYDEPTFTVIIIFTEQKCQRTTWKDIWGTCSIQCTTLPLNEL